MILFIFPPRPSIFFGLWNSIFLLPELGLGLENVLFIDDNPVEREQMRLDAVTQRLQAKQAAKTKQTGESANAS